MNSISSFTSKRVVTIFLLYFFLFGHTSILAQSASDSSRSQHAEQEKKSNDAPPEAKEQRLTKFFIIGEKAVGFESKPKKPKKPHKKPKKSPSIQNGIWQVENFGDINAYSILDVKLRPENWIIPFLKEKKFNILIVAELKKKGEDTWNRISVVNKYTWEIKKSSFAEEEEPKKEEVESKKEEEKKTSKEGSVDSNETASSERIKPFYIIDEILSDNPFLRVGDKVVALFFFDIKQPPVYLNDLKKAQRTGKSFITIDAQEMYLVTTGSAPQKYSAKDGDEITLRFLRAEYSVKRQKEVECFLKKGIEPPAPAKYTDIVNVEDEMNFIFKKFGIKLSVSPTIAYGSRVKNGLNSEEFNPISKNPSLGSNIYLFYDGRKPFLKKLINWSPGIHLSLLGLIDSGEENGPNEAEFTFGFVWSIPRLRNYFGFFYGWHNLKDPVFGVTFSPNIDFRALVSAEKNNKKK